MFCIQNFDKFDALLDNNIIYVYDLLLISGSY